jgi:hypothetical protein
VIEGGEDSKRTGVVSVAGGISDTNGSTSSSNNDGTRRNQSVTESTGKPLYVVARTHQDWPMFMMYAYEDWDRAYRKLFGWIEKDKSVAAPYLNDLRSTLHNPPTQHRTKNRGYTYMAFTFSDPLVYQDGDDFSNVLYRFLAAIQNQEVTEPV